MKKVLLFVVCIFVFGSMAYSEDTDNWKNLAENVVVETNDIDLYTITAGPFPDHSKKALKDQGHTDEEISEMEKALVYRRKIEFTERDVKFFKDQGATDQDIEEIKNQSNSSFELFALFKSSSVNEYFSRITIENWYKKSVYFKNALLKKAEEQGLNTVLFEKCLDKILHKPENEMALIPIKAIRNQTSKEAVWIIFCIWEYANTNQNTPESSFLSLSHVREWIIVEETQEITGFQTCR